METLIRRTEQPGTSGFDRRFRLVHSKHNFWIPMISHCECVYAKEQSLANSSSIFFDIIHTHSGCLLVRSAIESLFSNKAASASETVKLSQDLHTWLPWISRILPRESAAWSRVESSRVELSWVEMSCFSTKKIVIIYSLRILDHKYLSLSSTPFSYKRKKAPLHDSGPLGFPWPAVWDLDQKRESPKTDSSWWQGIKTDSGSLQSQNRFLLHTVAFFSRYTLLLSIQASCPAPSGAHTSHQRGAHGQIHVHANRQWEKHSVTPRTRPSHLNHMQTDSFWFKHPDFSKSSCDAREAMPAITSHPPPSMHATFSPSGTFITHEKESLQCFKRSHLPISTSPSVNPPQCLPCPSTIQFITGTYTYSTLPKYS